MWDLGIRFDDRWCWTMSLSNFSNGEYIGWYVSHVVRAMEISGLCRSCMKRQQRVKEDGSPHIVLRCDHMSWLILLRCATISSLILSLILLDVLCVHWRPSMAESH